MSSFLLTLLAVSLWVAFVGLAAVVVGFVYLVREVRKLIRQTRHMAAMYFPENINKAAEDGKSELSYPTSVTINDSWSEDVEGRS